MQDRVYVLDGVSNFRDFGGYDGVHGRVADGLLFRSGHFAKTSEADLQAIEALNIGLVVDLRRAFERAKEPPLWPSGERTQMIVGVEKDAVEIDPPHVAFLRSAELTRPSVTAFVQQSYRKLAFEDRLVDLYSRWLKGLDTVDGGALVCCAFGKDRTGIAAGMTLMMLGVPEETVLADYELTNRAVDLENRLPIAHETFCKTYDVNPPMDALIPMLGVEASYLRSSFDEMRERCGSIEGYLDMLGVDEAMRNRLKARYIQ